MNCFYYNERYRIYVRKKYIQCFQKYCTPGTYLLYFVLFFCSIPVFTQDAFTEGKKLLLNNRPEQALPLLYKAASEKNTDAKIRLYLGICYITLGKYTEAEQQLLIGKEKDQANSYLYTYNLGNIYFAQNRFTEAETAYTAALTAHNTYPSALLNRANTYVKLEKYSMALNDYKFYLNLEPATSQKQAIQRMVSLLEAQQHELNFIRMQEEAKKLAEEAQRQAEEERYRKLQEEINATLQSVDNAASLSAGSDETLDYLEDYNLD